MQDPKPIQRACTMTIHRKWHHNIGSCPYKVLSMPSFHFIFYDLCVSPCSCFFSMGKIVAWYRSPRFTLQGVRGQKCAPCSEPARAAFNSKHVHSIPHYSALHPAYPYKTLYNHFKGALYDRRLFKPILQSLTLLP